MSFSDCPLPLHGPGRPSPERPSPASRAAALLAPALFTALLLMPSASEALDSPSGGRSMIAGPARVVDGTTLEVGETRVRLAGIETPPPGKTCRAADGGRIAACHALAADALREVVTGGKITCTLLGPGESDGVPFGLCQTQDGLDVGTRLIRKGWARVGTVAPEGYLETEMRARSSVRGVWRSQPW